MRLRPMACLLYTSVQVAHLLAADTLWAALVVLTARLTLEPIDAGAL